MNRHNHPVQSSQIPGDNPHYTVKYLSPSPRRLPAILGSLVILMLGGGLVLSQSSLTFKGVPAPILMQFLTDPIAINAYFSQNPQELHDRLQVLGVEEAMKAYYRPTIPDEDELDRHIHQIFYELSGYIGSNYQVSPVGTLESKQQNRQQSAPASGTGFDAWFQLAQKAGVATRSEYRDGIHYIISPEGNATPYSTAAALFPEATLRQLIQIQELQATQ